MNKEERKQWVKDHKDKIVIAGVIAGTYALGIVLRGKRIQTKAELSISIGDELWSASERYHTNLALNKPDFTIGDLGKVGRYLMKRTPGVTKKTPLSYLNFDYGVSKR